jgi:hypothetical protein
VILRRLDGGRYSAVFPEWMGGTVVVLAGGPSVTREQIDIVEREYRVGALRCIAVNDAYLWAPWADVLYFADSHFWRWHEEGIDKPALDLTAAEVRERFAAFAGQKCTIANSGANVTDERVHMLQNRGTIWGLSRDPRALVEGRNSGFQALNLAILAGARRVLLLGFDGKPAEDGRTHALGGHPRPTPAEAYPLYVKAMREAAAAIRSCGVAVVNCSPGSAIDTFPRADLADALCPLRMAL